MAQSMLAAVFLIAMYEVLGFSLVQLRANQRSPKGGDDSLTEQLAATRIVTPVLTSDFGLSYVNWTLCNATFHSNLGGLGPDGGEESLRYYNIATAGGQAVDLVLTTTGEYTAKDVSINGLVQRNSCFGVVNVKSKKDSENSVTVNFDLVYHQTNTSVAFDHMYFTLFDLDESNNAAESITFYDNVNQVYPINGGSELERSGDLTSGLKFSSTEIGNGSDNPTDPESLTPLQKRRAVTVDFVEKNQWKVTFSVVGGKGGRNFVFGGRSNLVEAPIPSPVPTPPSPQVSIPMIVENVDFDSLTANETLKASFIESIKTTVAEKAGAGISTDDVSVTLSPGSVHADTVVFVPEGTSALDVFDSLQTTVSDGSLASAVGESLQLIDGVGQISSGTITVTVGAPIPTTLAPTLSPTLAPTALPTACADTLGTCTVHDDPHITVFDGKQISLLAIAGGGNMESQFKLSDHEGSGDMWLVKSSTVSVQARYAPIDELPEENLFVRALAVGGPFLNGSTLVVGPLDGKVTWNGAEILLSQTSNFSVDGLVSAERHMDSRLVQDMSQSNPGVDLEFPLGVKLTVNRQQSYVNVFIQMPRIAGGQDGLCGNFNGNADDDTLQLIVTERNPKVHVGESLFDLEFERRRARSSLHE